MFGRPSPFPGPDPYLGKQWGSIPICTLVALSTALNANGALPASLVARNHYKHVWLNPNSNPIRDRYVRILDHSAGGRVVTHIEFLRRDHRMPGRPHTAYLRRLRTCQFNRISVVEIDLLRYPRSVAPLWIPPDAPDSSGLISVRRAPETCWSTQRVHLRSPAPRLAIPLRPGEPDIELELQPLLDRIYVEGCYDQTTNYTIDSDPPLPPPDAAWADELLRAAGRR